MLLADGFAAIEVDGRRLAVVGMILIGVVTLSAVQSLWWAIVPMLAGWVVWLATEAILATFDIKLSLSGGPLVAQIIVLTMPAASHLAIHFRDDRRREADPRQAARSTLAAVAAPIVWTAITGAIGYGALVTSDVVPIQQFGAILGTCTFGAAILVMLISPIAMLPPFRLEIPVRHGSHSPVAGLMNRLILWVYRHPGAIVVGVFAVVLPVAARAVSSQLRNQLHQSVSARDPRRQRLPHGRIQARRHRLGRAGRARGPVARAAHALHDLEERRGSDSGRSGSPTPRRSPRCSRWPRCSTRTDGWPPCPRDRQDRLLADKLELIAASPQSELLRSFWNAEAGETRILIRLKEQQPAPDKSRIFREATAAAAEQFGPTSYLTGLSFLMTRTTEAIIATQWGTFLWSAIGILLDADPGVSQPGPRLAGHHADAACRSPWCWA